MAVTIPVLTFDPDVTITPDNKVIFSGTESGSVAKIDMLNNGADIGSAQISNGKWSFTQDLGTSGTSLFEIEAIITDTIGNKNTVTDNTFVDGNIIDSPYKTLTETIDFSTLNGSMKFYSDKGAVEYHGDYKFSGDQNDSFSSVETGDQIHTQFVFVSTPGADQTITNFHISGQQHDTVLLPHADFTTMADVLRQTTMSGGNAVIHDPNSTATLALMGVTKAEMKSHQADFSFHGSGQFVPTVA